MEAHGASRGNVSADNEKPRQGRHCDGQRAYEPSCRPAGAQTITGILVPTAHAVGCDVSPFQGSVPVRRDRRKCHGPAQTRA